MVFFGVFPLGEGFSNQVVLSMSNAHCVIFEIFVPSYSVLVSTSRLPMPFVHRSFLFLNPRSTSTLLAKANTLLCNFVITQHQVPHSFAHCVSTAYLKISVSQYLFLEKALHPNFQFYVLQDPKIEESEEYSFDITPCRRA